MPYGGDHAGTEGNTMDDIKAEADALLGMFEQRGLTPQEACAIMGVAITSLIADDKTARAVIATLQRQFQNRT